MERDKTFWYGFSGFILVLVLAFGLNGILDIAGFESTYLESIINQYTIQGEAAKNKIETSLNLGKKLHLLKDQYDDIFYSILKQNSGIMHFYVANADSKIVYTTRLGSNRIDVPFVIEHTRDLRSGENRPSVNTVKFLNVYYICISLFSENRSFQGTLIAEFSEAAISAYVYKVGITVFKFALILILCSIVSYLLLSWVFASKPKAEAVILVIILLTSQSIFTIHNNALYNRIITSVFNKNMSVLAKSVADELRTPLDYGIRINNLGDANSYLAKHIQGNPQCSDAYITDGNLNILFEAHRNASIKNIDEYNRLSHHDGDLNTIQLASNYGTGYLVLRINRSMINGILRDIAMDSVTIIVVALIFAFILKDLFAFMAARKLITKNHAVVEVSEFEKYNLRLIKISTFLFMFAAFETLSFMPILIQNIYYKNPIDIFGLSEETIVSLPMSVYMFGIMFSMFVSIFALKKLNVWKRHIIMAVIFIIGSAAAIFAKTFVVFTAFRFITGVGYGGVLLNLASIVMYYTSAKNRSVGFGTNAAAFAAASICSIPVGGLIVNKFGYHTGILVSVAFGVLFLVFSIVCVISEKGKNAASEKISEERFSFAEFLVIMRSKFVIVYILCINIPFQLIYVGLFQFMLPIYMNDSLRLSQNNIGRILSIFSIVSLGAAIVSRLSDWAKNDKLLLAIGASLVGIVLIVFGLYPEGGMFLFFAIMIGMGIDNLFIDAIEEVYISNGNIKNVSEESLIQSYKTIEKIVSVFIPTITGLIIAHTGFYVSVLLIGLWCVIGASSFVFLGYNGRWKKEKTCEI